MTHRDEGFTLIELLVVILIVAILAAVAVPVFLRQREKGWEAQVHSVLKNTATAVECYYVDTGSYEPLNAYPQLEDRLDTCGYRKPSWAANPGYVRMKATANTYCIEVGHKDLPDSNAWHKATYESGVGKPQAIPGDCPS